MGSVTLTINYESARDAVLPSFRADLCEGCGARLRRSRVSMPFLVCWLERLPVTAGGGFESRGSSCANTGVGPAENEMVGPVENETTGNCVTRELCQSSPPHLPLDLRMSSTASRAA